MMFLESVRVPLKKKLYIYTQLYSCNERVVQNKKNKTHIRYNFYMKSTGSIKMNPDLATVWNIVKLNIIFILFFKRHVEFDKFLRW